MTTETEQLSDLIRDVVSSYVEHGDELSIEAVEHPGAVYWTIRGHADDYGKLVGRGGAHFEALRTLIGGFGAARDELHVLNRLTEPDATRRTRPGDPEPRLTYDPRGIRDLLSRVLAELVGDFNVEAAVKPNREPRIPFPLLVQLRITLRSEDDRESLVGGERPLIAALGALFRARAIRDGVGVQVEILPPT